MYHSNCVDLAEDDVIVSVPAEEGGGVIIVRVAVGLRTVRFKHLVRVVHIPLVSCAGGWETTAWVSTAIFISVELHTRGVASHHATGSVYGKFRWTHVIDVEGALGAVTPVFVRVLL